MWGGGSKDPQGPDAGPKEARSRPGKTSAALSNMCICPYIKITMCMYMSEHLTARLH